MACQALNIIINEPYYFLKLLLTLNWIFQQISNQIKNTIISIVVKNNSSLQTNFILLSSIFVCLTKLIFVWISSQIKELQLEILFFKVYLSNVVFYLFYIFCNIQFTIHFFYPLHFLHFYYVQNLLKTFCKCSFIYLSCLLFIIWYIYFWLYKF